jgi:Flp pilus assembly protein TadD
MNATDRTFTWVALAGAVLFIGLILGACAATKTATQPEKKTIPSGQKESSGEVSSPNPAFLAEFQKSLSYIGQGRPDLAQKILEGLASSHKDRGEIFNALGVVYKKQGMTDKAVESYRQAIDLKDSNVEAHYNLGILYREKGEFKKSEEEYKRAISLDPKFAEAHYNLGILYDLYLNQPEAALKQYKEYKQLAGGNKQLDVWIKDLSRRTKSDESKGMAAPSGGVQ